MTVLLSNFAAETSDRKKRAKVTRINHSKCRQMNPKIKPTRDFSTQLPWLRRLKATPTIHIHLLD